MFGRNGDDGYGGGGFDVSGFGETPQSDKKQGPRRTEHIVPVTARQVIESSENGLKIGNIDLESQLVKLVGIVKKVERSSVKTMYTLEDNTGSIVGVHWLEPDADEDFVPPVVENTYASMVGAIRNITAEHNQRTIAAYKIFPVTDLNEVTAHTLQIIHISLKAEEMSQQTTLPTIKQEMSSTYGGMDTSMGGGTGYADGFNLNPQQQRVLKALADNDSEIGASVEQVMNSLTVKMPFKEVKNILDFLSNEGHVYETGQNTYKALILN